MTRADADKCPFANDVAFALSRGDVVWLQGPSGVGKTTVAGEVAGLGGASVTRRLGFAVEVTWDAAVPPRERCGAMFQQTTLIDALSVGGNVAHALAARGGAAPGEAKRLVRDRRGLRQTSAARFEMLVGADRGEYITRGDTAGREPERPRDDRGDNLIQSTAAPPQTGRGRGPGLGARRAEDAPGALGWHGAPRVARRARTKRHTTRGAKVSWTSGEVRGFRAGRSRCSSRSGSASWSSTSRSRGWTKPRRAPSPRSSLR